MKTDEIITSRLILRSITPALINELFNNKSKDEIKEYLGLDENGFEHYRDMHENGMETNRLSLHAFLLILKDSQEPIGECGFHTWNRRHRRSELFYVIHQDSLKNKGYMSEALGAVLEYGFTKLGMHRIAAMVASSNIPSVRLLQRYGFQFEGTMREDYNVNGTNESSDCYSLLKWEWDLRH